MRVLFCFFAVQTSILHLVPPVIVGMMKYPKLKDYDLSFVHSIKSGAAPLKPETIDVIKSLIPSATIYQGKSLSNLIRVTINKYQF